MGDERYVREDTVFTGKSRKKRRAVFSEAGLGGDAHEPLAPCVKV